MTNLVSSLKSAGVPLDGIGFQGHFIVGEVPTSMATVMNQITALGVEVSRTHSVSCDGGQGRANPTVLQVAITELDIRMTLPSTQTLLNQQKTDYTTVISQCTKVSKCIGVTVWDWTDKVRCQNSLPGPS